MTRTSYGNVVKDCRTVVYIVFFLVALPPATSNVHTFYMADICEKPGGKLDLSDTDIHAIILEYTRKKQMYYCEVTITTNWTNRFLVQFEQLKLRCENKLHFYDGDRERTYVEGLSKGICGTQLLPGVYNTTYQYLTIIYWATIVPKELPTFSIAITSFHTGDCQSWEYTCDNGICIDQNLPCNGHNPCGDHSDCKHGNNKEKTRRVDSSFPTYTIIVICIALGFLLIAVVALILFYRQRQGRSYHATQQHEDL